MTDSSLVKDVAARFKRSKRTVERWAADGLDLSDDGAVSEYVRQLEWRSVGKARTDVVRRKHQAESKPASPDVRKVLAELETVDPSSEGAAAALKRLQEFERNSSGRLNVAIAKGDPFLISSTTKDHVAIAGALIKFENLVAAEARVSGALLSKAEMEDAVRAIASWIRLAFQSWLSSETPNLVALDNPHVFVGEARKGFAFAVKEGFENSRKSRNGIPVWVADIFASNYGYNED